MASLLAKFRIDYHDVTVIPDVTKKAKDETKWQSDKAFTPAFYSRSNEQYKLAQQPVKYAKGYT